MRILNDVCNESRLCFYQARRYWPESVAAFTATLCVFSGFIYGVMAIGDVSIDSGKLDGLIVGFTLWFFASTAYSSISSETSEEIRQRTLEQICIAPTPLWAILGTRAMLKIAAGLVVLLVMLAIVEVITGGRLNINYATMMGAVLLATPSLVGLGYMMSGLLLVVRKGEALQMLVYPALMALVAYPAYPMNMAAALPFAYGASAAKVATSGQDLPWTSYLAIGLISLFWLHAGLLVFRWLESRAKRLGVMGHL